MALTVSDCKSNFIPTQGNCDTNFVLVTDLGPWIKSAAIKQILLIIDPAVLSSPTFSKRHFQVIFSTCAVRRHPGAAYPGNDSVLHVNHSYCISHGCLTCILSSHLWPRSTLFVTFRSALTVMAPLVSSQQIQALAASMTLGRGTICTQDRQPTRDTAATLICIIFIAEQQKDSVLPGSTIQAERKHCAAIKCLYPPERQPTQLSPIHWISFLFIFY